MSTPTNPDISVSEAIVHVMPELIIAKHALGVMAGEMEANNTGDTYTNPIKGLKTAIWMIEVMQVSGVVDQVGTLGSDDTSIINQDAEWAVFTDLLRKRIQQKETESGR